MRKETELWLNELSLPIELLPQKWSLPTMAVVEAAECVYDKIKNGEHIKPIRIGWRIRNIASGIANRKDILEVRAIETAHETIIRLKTENTTFQHEVKKIQEELDKYRLPIRTKVWNFLTKKRSMRGFFKK
jgi:hypothetical protein